MKILKYTLIKSIFVLPFAVQAETVADRYPGPWESEFNFEITKALTKAKVGSCGTFKYRASSMNKGEYLVYCTSDLKKLESIYGLAKHRKGAWAI